MKKVITAIFIVITFSACTRINPTEAGFKISNSGNYRGIDSLPLLTGWQFYMPGFSRIITIPTTQQHVVWSSDANEGKGVNQEITISCLGGAGFRMDIGMNYRVNPYKASRIYLKYATDDLQSISNTYLRNVVRGAMQDVSGHITVDSILNNLPGFEQTVFVNLKTKLEPEGFYIDLFNIIKQPTASDPALANSINQKIKAKQDAETSIMQLQQSVADANKKIATARGDSASAVIQAQGEAEAIKVKQQFITVAYVDYIKAQAWDGHYPTTYLNGATGALLNIK